MWNTAKSKDELFKKTMKEIWIGIGAINNNLERFDEGIREIQELRKQRESYKQEYKPKTKIN